MEILLVSATKQEVAPILEICTRDWIQFAEMGFSWGQLQVSFLITGVGIGNTAMHLGAAFTRGKPDLAIQAGVGGSFSEKLPIGSVAHVTEERFADLGAEQSDGTFSDVFDLQLADPDGHPFTGGKLLNREAADFPFLTTARGITVNKVHGKNESIRSVIKQYDPEIESMEGAAFFLACLTFGVSFLEIRSISNLVEPRNREAWDLDLAIKNLNTALEEIFSVLQH